MSIWNIFKRGKAAEGLTYGTFERWTDKVMSAPIPSNVVAFCFNLYEDADKHWTIELIGADSFSATDSDWACDEVFTTRDNPLTWHEDKEYPHILSEAESLIRQYLRQGKFKKELTERQGLAVGFVDGDLIML